MQWTGNAVVTFVLESEHYRYETDRELIVLDPEKTPSFTQKVYNPVFNVAPGSTFTAQDLLGGIASVDYLAFCQENRLPYPDTEVKVEETDTPGILYDENSGVFTLEDYGVYDLNLNLRIANLLLHRVIHSILNDTLSCLFCFINQTAKLCVCSGIHSKC